MSLCVSKNVTPWDFLPFGKTKLEFNKRWKLDRFGYKERREDSLFYPFSILGWRPKTLLGFLIWISKCFDNSKLRQLSDWNTSQIQVKSHIIKFNLAKRFLRSAQPFTFGIRYWDWIKFHQMQKKAKGPPLKDVRFFFAIFDIPIRHVGILALICLTSTY